MSDSPTSHSPAVDSPVEALFIKTRSGKRGPFSMQQLQRYVDAGAILPKSAIGDGEGQWVAAKDVEGLVFPDSDPATVKRSADRIVSTESMPPKKSPGERRQEVDPQRQELESERESLQARRAEFEAQRESFEQVQAESKARLESERASLDELRNDLQQREDQLLQREQQAEATEQQVAEAQTRAQDLLNREGELSQREQELAQREQDLQEREDALTTKTQEVERRELAVSEAESKLEKQQAETESHLQQREQSVAEQEQQLDRRLEDVQQREQLLQEKQASVEEAESEVQRREGELDLRQQDVDRQSREAAAQLAEAETYLAQKRDEEELKKSFESIMEQKQELLKEFAARQESLAQRETELMRRERELTSRELLIAAADAPSNDVADDSLESQVVPEYEAEAAEDLLRPSSWEEVLGRNADGVAETDVVIDEGTAVANESIEDEGSAQVLPKSQPEQPLPFATFRINALQQRFGPCSEVLEDDDARMKVDVLVHPPSGSRDFTTLVTHGMSDYPIPMPQGQRSVRAELMLYVTQVDETAVRLIRAAAKIPYQKKQGLTIGTTASPENLSEFLTGTYEKGCVYMLPVKEEDSKPIAAQEYVDGSIHLFWLMMITDAERALIESSGIHRFLSLLEKNNHGIYFDLTRDCYVKRKGWFRR